MRRAVFYEYRQQRERVGGAARGALSVTEATRAGPHADERRDEAEHCGADEQCLLERRVRAAAAAWAVAWQLCEPLMGGTQVPTATRWIVSRLA